jgi:hypothetical protein
MSNFGASITRQIDLAGNWNAVRDQGDRPTCLACATSDAHAVHQKSAPLSAEYLFYYGFQQAKGDPASDGLHFDEIAFALKNSGQPVETDWPYQMMQADPWIPPQVGKLWLAGLAHDDRDAMAIISGHLRIGTPVVLGLQLSGAFLAPLPLDCTIDGHGPGFGGHAVLAVGLGHGRSGETFFLIRNSWGEGWGDHGYAWLSTDYLHDKLIGYGAVNDP